jgi:hypothetical protein
VRGWGGITLGVSRDRIRFLLVAVKTAAIKSKSALRQAQ